MAFSSLEKLPELKVASQDTYFVRADYGALQIDVLLTQNPLFKKVQRFLDRDIPIASVEGLLLLKLYIQRCPAQSAERLTQTVRPFP